MFSSRPKCLDLFCCGGGAARGLIAAGFDVLGVDLDFNPDYPAPMVIGDATNPPVELAAFDFIWASPPCQIFSKSHKMNPRRQHVDLIDATRKVLRSSRAIHVIENVCGAPLRRDLILDGRMFGLRVLRRRVFESSIFLWAPGMPDLPHRVAGGVVAKPNTSTPFDRFVSVWGSHHGRRTLDNMADAMGMPADLNERTVSQAIPPAYSEFIGTQVIEALAKKRSA